MSNIIKLDDSTIGWCDYYNCVTELEDFNGLEFASIPSDERATTNAYCMECGVGRDVNHLIRKA